MSDPKAVKCRCGGYLTRKRANAARLEGLGWRIRMKDGEPLLSKECARCNKLTLLRMDDIFPSPA